MYSIFKIFTTEGWNLIPDAIASKTSPGVAILSTAYFIMILVTGGILGMSLVNSIFVDAMVEDNNDELEAKMDDMNEKIDHLTDTIEKLTGDKNK